MGNKEKGLGGLFIVLLVLGVLVYESGFLWWGLGAGVFAAVVTAITARSLQLDWTLPVYVGFGIAALVWGYGVADHLGFT
ncbi:MAG: hypothetical protein OXC99_09675 [Chloroflexi bacterium]|nr:hypothetical protein [Chloroflexota bacterium]